MSLNYNYNKEQRWYFERDNCVLLVIDLQNDFLEDGAVFEVPNGRKHIPKIKALIDFCREIKLPIIYTVHIHNPHYNFNIRETEVFPMLKTEGLRDNTRGAMVYEEIAPTEKDIIIKKMRFSAFYNTELELILKNIKGNNIIDTLIICGVASNICCETTARDAFMRDYKVVFGSDVNISFNETDHLATLHNINEIFGRVMSCEDIISALKKGKG